jgi:hypothetical protein
LVEAWTDPGSPVWVPATVEVSASPATVLLAAADHASFGTVRADLRSGGEPVAGAVEWRVDGVPWRTLPVGMPEGSATAIVPAGRDVEVEVTVGPGTPHVALPEPQTVRLAGGERRSLEFLFDARVAVQFRLPAEDVTQATVYLWRRPPGRLAQYLGSTAARTDGKAGQLVLSPGSYAAMVTDAGTGHPPAWTTFRVDAPGPMDVVLSLPPEPRRFRVRLVTAEGNPVAGAGLWIGRMEGASPTDAVVATATTADDGWATFPLLPAGDYLVADFHNESAWCDLPLARSPPEDVVLVRAKLADEKVTLVGRVWGPDGRPIASAHAWIRAEGAVWGTYEGISDGSFTAMDLPAGRLVVSIPHSWMREGRHGPAEVRLSVAPGEERRVEIRLPPR